MTSTPPAELLKGVRFFEGLPDTLLWHLGKAGSPRSFAVDEMLFREGDERSFFAVLLRGSVAIEHGPAGTRVATLGPGEMLGEGVLFDESVHGASGRAVLATDALFFSKRELEPLLRDKPALHAALVARAAHSIAARLKRADARITGRGLTPAFGVATRREHDLIGERDVPDAALYGIQTLRALENFPITGVSLRDFPELIVALAQVK